MSEELFELSKVINQDIVDIIRAYQLVEQGQIFHNLLEKYHNLFIH